MTKAIAFIGILLVLTGTYLVYVSTETKGQPAVIGPTPGTPEAREWTARQELYQKKAAIGFALIVVGSLLSVPLILRTP